MHRHLSLGLSCFGDVSFPCSRENSTWKALVLSKTDDYSDLRFEVEVRSNTSVFTCSKANPCNVAQNSFVAFPTNNSAECKSRVVNIKYLGVNSI